MDTVIRIKGARAHNLKNISLEIPRDKLIVVTGLSGSGKSSLAFDTIYAEGQRRYVESLSSYARQFLGQMDKPDVDSIDGLSPAISIDQKTTSRNPRSTVGTVTEIYDYLRLLFARVGQPHCPNCGKLIAQQTIDQMLDQILSLPEKTKILVIAQIVRAKKGEHRNVFAAVRRDGYVRVRVDGTIYDVNDDIILDKNKKHTIEVVIDRLAIRPDVKGRLADSLEMALKLGGGVVYIDVVKENSAENPAAKNETLMFSQNFACVDCGISLPEIAPRMFSFNNPFGACPTCSGLGSNMHFDESLVIPDAEKSIVDGAIAPISKNLASYAMCQIDAVLRKHRQKLETPWQNLLAKVKDILLHGSGSETITFEYENMFGEVKTHSTYFEGIMPLLERRYKESASDEMREYYENFMTETPCPTCRGSRLKPETLAVTVGEKNISDVTALSVRDALPFFAHLEKSALSAREKTIAAMILKEIKARLGFLAHVGLGYLTLSRSAGTLSGGEAQRIRLATQIGSGLVGVLYILDEPSIGLHQRDNSKLLEALCHLRDLGNTLIVVEHDEETMRSADQIIDIGPGAGDRGGEVVAQGTAAEIAAVKDSITGQYLAGKKSIPLPAIRRQGSGKTLTVVKAAENNLKNLTVSFPLGCFIVVTGVSGSGKSSLVNEILYKGIASRLYKTKGRAGKHKEIRGLENIDKVINVDQSPIGRTPRSNPATYTGVFDAIRDLFSRTNEAKMRGYKAGRFSFNVKGGRCEACRGDGIIKIEMHFLPDVYVPCEVCGGARYNRETLEAKYKGKSISDVLNMTIDEALELFQNIPQIARKLKIISEVGLGYIKVGQPATTLSGGEAQRVKLATELSRRSTGKTLYILDEPTTGLHTDDIARLLTILQRLVDGGDTVIVIEHNLDVIKTADYIIDLGPEGGDEGGTVVATGTPEEIAKVKKSYTGQFLKKVLARRESRRKK